MYSINVTNSANNAQITRFYCVNNISGVIISGKIHNWIFSVETKAVIIIFKFVKKVIYSDLI